VELEICITQPIFFRRFHWLDFADPIQACSFADGQYFHLYLVNADYQIVSLVSLSKCPFFIIDAAVWFLGFLLMIKGQVQVLFNLY
jgi:hypothetical protein